MNPAFSSSTKTKPGPKRPYRVPVPIRNPITLVLLWASKSDPRLIAVCSRWARSTQVAFGIFVLFTSVLALTAAYYTLSTFNVPQWWSRSLAVAWAILVFFIDREIVGGLGRKTALVRPLLALIIGTVVAVPIELWVFQERLDQELTRQYQQDNREQINQLRASYAELEKRRADLRGAIADLRRQETDWAKVMDDELVGRSKFGRTGVAGEGPVFRNAATQQAVVHQRMRELRLDLDQLERTMPAEREQMEKQFRRQEIAKVSDFVTRYETLQRITNSSASLYWMSWGITLFFVLLEMTPALMKILTPQVDYHHLVNAEIRENIARIDEIADRNYRLAMENPERPELSVSEKFAYVRYEPVDADARWSESFQ